MSRLPPRVVSNRRPDFSIKNRDPAFFDLIWAFGEPPGAAAIRRTKHNDLYRISLGQLILSRRRGPYRPRESGEDDARVGPARQVKAYGAVICFSVSPSAPPVSALTKIQNRERRFLTFANGVNTATNDWNYLWIWTETVA